MISVHLDRFFSRLRSTDDFIKAGCGSLVVVHLLKRFLYFFFSLFLHFFFFFHKRSSNDLNAVKLLLLFYLAHHAWTKISAECSNYGEKCIEIESASPQPSSHSSV